MTLSEELIWRGLVKDKTFNDLHWLDEPKSFYLGIDASADSLTVGNLAIIVLARCLAAAGWHAVLLMGGGTSLVGDPGGKAEERQLLSRETVQQNIAGLRQQVEKLFGGTNFELVDNYDWLAELKYVDFLREVGKHFSMTELLQRDFVTERMGEGGSGISYAEFSYSLVQGYDFWHLFKEKQVVLQIGGSDQWGNMLSGVALIRKQENQEAQALSMPLIINKLTGVKFGKSEGGAIWLDPAKTTPAEFYQFWINTNDADVGDYLKVFTQLSKDELASTMEAFEKNRGERLAQETLAYKVTELVHGQPAADEAQRYAKNLRVGSVEGVADVPTITVTEGTSVVDALVTAGLASSKTEARQLLSGGGVYINDQQTAKEHFAATDFQDGVLKLRRGKTLQHTTIVRLKQ